MQAFSPIGSAGFQPAFFARHGMFTCANVSEAPSITECLFIIS
jgi:hypothetical protein